MKKPRDGKDVLELASEIGAKFLDLKFSDPFGLLQHFSVPISEISEETFSEGLGFDGSSIRMWQSIHESDMLAVPDPKTAVPDPFYKYPTLSVFCDIYDPITREPYWKDTRFIAKKAEMYLKSTGIADSTLFGPEAEFFIFDSIEYDESNNFSYYRIDSVEGFWNTGKSSDGEKNLGYKLRNKEGYFPAPPHDTLTDVRNEVVEILEKMGIKVEVHHHEVASAGQGEVDMKALPLVEMADTLLIFKYVLKNVARKHGKVATFMPKPIFGDNANGMHVHQSLWKGGKPLFAGEKYGGVSELTLWYIGGIIKHAKSFCAFTCPTVNSYRRLVPGFEAPINLAYSARNRSAGIRIPMYSPSPTAKRIEVRFPDPICNPYLAFSAMLLAGIDGIIKKIDPGPPLDKDIYKLPPEILSKVDSTPPTLLDAIEALKKDNDYLLKGDVFAQQFIDDWVEWKMEKEIKESLLRPTPWEFKMYFDA